MAVYVFLIGDIRSNSVISSKRKPCILVNEDFI